MPAKQFGDTDSFIGHSSRGKKTSFVGKWKDETDENGQHSLTCWLHMRARPFAIWVHGFPKVIIKKDNDEESRFVVWGKYNCHEEEDVLKEQFKTDKTTGDRIVPPKVCGFCKFIEWCRDQVRSGALPWTKPIFRFDHEDPRKTIVIHAAGIYNGYRGELTPDQKTELRDAGIALDRAWSENGQAKCDYMMTVVDHKNPEAGPVILHETSLVGDCLKNVLADQRDSLGAEKGDPWLHPYAIKFMYLKDEVPMKKYKARALTQLPITPLIKQMIEGQAPDLTRAIAPFDPKMMRTFLETHCLLKNVPWDDLFDAHSHQPSTEHQEQEQHEDHEETAPKSNGSTAADDDLVECDKCSKPMKMTDPKCPHCGAEYEIESAAPPQQEPSKPPMKKRSEMKKDEVKGKGGRVPF